MRFQALSMAKLFAITLAAFLILIASPVMAVALMVIFGVVGIPLPFGFAMFVSIIILIGMAYKKMKKE